MENRMSRLASLLPKPKQQFSIVLVVDVEDVDEDGESIPDDEEACAQSTIIEFVVDEQDMKTFQRVLNANGYLYSVQPLVEGDC
jgi:hypothetical protein